jgi:hypothetical protein
MTDMITIYGHTFPVDVIAASMAAREVNIRRDRYEWLRAEIGRVIQIEDYDRLPTLCAEARALQSVINA